MSQIVSRTDTPNSQQQLDEVWFRTDQLRVTGQWNDALTLLAAYRSVANESGSAARARHALATACVLTDQAGFGGFDTWIERSQQLEMALAEAQQTPELALLGAIWDARGMSLHHQYLDTGRTVEPPEELSSFECGLHYHQQIGDQHGIAESLFHIGLVYGVVRQNHHQALPYLQQSYELAQMLGDTITASYAIRHIGFAQYDAGDLVQARASLQESLTLREHAQFIPGVAMALVMLAYADAELKDHTHALAHLQRAKTIFLDLSAAKKVEWVEHLINEFQAAAP